MADRRDRRRHVDLDLDSLPEREVEGPDATRADDLVDLLRTVSDEHALVFEARILRGLPVDAVAADLGLSRRTVQYRLRAALTWLAARLASE